jgi:hypothetical protein
MRARREVRYWLPPSQQPKTKPIPFVRSCLAAHHYLTGNPMVVGETRDAWARCIREPWNHDGNHLADIPGRGLREFPRAI